MKPLFLLTFAALAACGPVNRSLDTQKAPVVSTVEAEYDLRFTGDALDAAQSAAFGSYLDALSVGYGDRIGASAATAGQRRVIDALLMPRGLSLDPAPLGVAAPGAVHLTIRQAHATVGSCPDWRRVSNPEIDGSTMSNYGCAATANLAAMLADPNELIEGKTYTASDASTIAKGIAAYRTKPATGLEPLQAGRTTSRDR